MQIFESLGSDSEICPKCGSAVSGGKCNQCNYSHETSLSMEEAREMTASG
ncbi:MAG: hypothetical protein ACYC7D_10655 [Nitrososphaerales archaeon]